VDLLVIALCTILVGGDSFYDMEEFAEVRLSWFKTFLRLRNGPPSHDTFNRVFRALDGRQLADSLSRWTQSVRTVLRGEVVALDGKSVRRALNRGEYFRVIVSAWASAPGRRKAVCYWASAKSGTKATRSRSCPNCCKPWNWPVAS